MSAQLPSTVPTEYGDLYDATSALVEPLNQVRVSLFFPPFALTGLGGGITYPSPDWGPDGTLGQATSQAAFCFRPGSVGSLDRPTASS